MKTINYLIVFASIVMANDSNAQTTGILKGTVTNENNAAMMFATVAVMEDSTIITGTTTDENGDYTIREIGSGKYTIRFSFVAYKTSKIKNVEISPNKISYVNYKMIPDNMLGPIEVYAAWQKPIVNPQYSTVTSLTIDQIENMAVQKGDIVSMIINVTPGVMPTPDGKNLYIRGSRQGSTVYYIDGNKVMGSADVPGNGIAGIEVITGGVPAEYGDCTGGVVIITTKEYKMEMRRKEIKKREREEQQTSALQ